MVDKPRTLAEFELVVMLAVMHVGDEGYSVTIRDDIRKRTGRRVARGALYVTLDRLCQKRLLESWKGESTPERGGRAKRHYRPTPEGLRAVRASRDLLQEMFEGIDAAERRA